MIVKPKPCLFSLTFSILQMPKPKSMYCFFLFKTAEPEPSLTYKVSH